MTYKMFDKCTENELAVLWAVARYAHGALAREAEEITFSDDLNWRTDMSYACIAQTCCVVNEIKDYLPREINLTSEHILETLESLDKKHFCRLRPKLTPDQVKERMSLSIRDESGEEVQMPAIDPNDPSMRLADFPHIAFKLMAREMYLKKKGE